MLAKRTSPCQDIKALHTVAKQKLQIHPKGKGAKPVPEEAKIQILTAFSNVYDTMNCNTLGITSMAEEGSTEQYPRWVQEAKVFAMYKPRGMLTTNKPLENIQLDHRRGSMGVWEREMSEEAGGVRLFHIGRLDKKTSGLIFCTSVGMFGKFICTPGMLPKEYVATSERLATPEMVEQLLVGVELQDGPAKALECEVARVETFPVTIIDRKEKEDRKTRKRKRAAGEEPATKTIDKTRSDIRIVLNIGRNHIVKRMLDHIGLSVTKLHRTAIGPVSLESLGLSEPGQHVQLSEEHLKQLWDARCKTTEVDENAEDDEN